MKDCYKDSCRDASLGTPHFSWYAPWVATFKQLGLQMARRTCWKYCYKTLMTAVTEVADW